MSLESQLPTELAPVLKVYAADVKHFESNKYDPDIRVLGVLNISHRALKHLREKGAVNSFRLALSTPKILDDWKLCGSSMSLGQNIESAQLTQIQLQGRPPQEVLLVQFSNPQKLPSNEKQFFLADFSDPQHNHFLVCDLD